jgi:hypothetical protein
LTLTETLFTTIVQVATVFFVLLPIISALKEEKVYISQGFFDNIRTILILFLTEIGSLLVAMYLQDFPISGPTTYSQPLAEGFTIAISIAFFFTVMLVFRIGYRLLTKITR